MAEELEVPFQFLEQQQRMDSVRYYARQLALEIQNSTPAGPNQILAMRHVEDALTRAHKAIFQDAEDNSQQSWTVYIDLEDSGQHYQGSLLLSMSLLTAFSIG
jgi:hypothetical protein